MYVCMSVCLYVCMYVDAAKADAAVHVAPVDEVRLHARHECTCDGPVGHRVSADVATK